MRRLAAAGQVFHQRHLVEVEGRVETALVHLQLVTQSVDVVFGWRQSHKNGASAHRDAAAMFIKTFTCNHERETEER